MTELEMTSTMDLVDELYRRCDVLFLAGAILGREPKSPLAVKGSQAAVNYLLTSTIRGLNDKEM